jgi:peptidyl-prolyl cis-trans isomerase SDCCAG10
MIVSQVDEPSTSGKLIMKTTFGDLEIELWSKEAPIACKNFL